MTGNALPTAAGIRTVATAHPSFHPPAGATASHAPNGGMTYSHAGLSYSTDRNGRLSSISKPGMESHYGSNGALRSARLSRTDGSQMHVSQGMHGERHVETVRPDHTRVVSWGPHAGYVERPFRPGYVTRTYVDGNHTYAHVYRAYYYRGVTYYGYLPPVYYGPRFYGWAWNPWPGPVVFTWGWIDRPWYGYYSSYFAPASGYSTAALWLTDYLLAEELQLAWEQRQAALAAPQEAQYQPPSPPLTSGGGVILTADVKQAIAGEVSQQISAEYTAANQLDSKAVTPAGEQAPAALDPRHRIFVVSTALAVNAAGQECGLTPGDVIARGDYTMISARNTVSVRVLASKPGDCPINAETDVDVAALEEMHNQFQERVDSGLKMLADNQGKGGLPAAPPPDPRLSPDGQPPADSAAGVDSAVTEQQQDADRALQEVRQVTAGAGG